ncbi:MAG: Rieske (2Fe-2S) protein, partial [bacterium]
AGLPVAFPAFKAIRLWDCEDFYGTQMNNSGEDQAAHFVKVANTWEIAEGQNLVIQFQTKEVVIFNVQGTYYALDNLCPHRNGPLSEGEVSVGTVMCPWHGARFDLKTGKGLIGPHQSDVRAYPVLVEGTDLKILSCK